MQYMKLVVLNKFLKTIESLSMSTELKIILKNETYVFNRLNANAISSKFVNIELQGHNIEKFIVLQNHTKTLIIVESNYCLFYKDNYVKIDTNMQHLKHGSFLIKNIINRIPMEFLPKWILDNNNIVSYYFVDNFNGFEDRKPLFDKNNYFKFKVVSKQLDIEKIIYEEKTINEKTIDNWNNKIANTDYPI